MDLTYHLGPNYVDSKTNKDYYRHIKFVRYSENKIIIETGLIIFLYSIE
jgi:hypothetical protein